MMLRLTRDGDGSSLTQLASLPGRLDEEAKLTEMKSEAFAFGDAFPYYQVLTCRFIPHTTRLNLETYEIARLQVFIYFRVTKGILKRGITRGCPVAARAADAHEIHTRFLTKTGDVWVASRLIETLSIALGSNVARR